MSLQRFNLRTVRARMPIVCYGAEGSSAMVEERIGICNRVSLFYVCSFLLSLLLKINKLEYNQSRVVRNKIRAKVFTYIKKDD